MIGKAWRWTAIAVLVVVSACQKSAEQSGGDNATANVANNLPVETSNAAEPLAALSKRLLSSAIKDENRGDRNGYTYDGKVETVRKDFTGDGVLDAIIIVTTCEKNNCHPTTQGSVITVAKGAGEGFVPSLSFASHIAPKVKSSSRKSISIVSRKFGEDDPHCCPEEVHLQTITSAPDGSFHVRDEVTPSQYQGPDLSRLTETEGPLTSAFEVDGKRIPTVLQGQWGTSKANCKNQDDYGPITISPNGFQHYEVSANVIRIDKVGPWSIRIDFSSEDAARVRTH